MSGLALLYGKINLLNFSAFYDLLDFSTGQLNLLSVILCVIFFLLETIVFVYLNQMIYADHATLLCHSFF